MLEIHPIFLKEFYVYKCSFEYIDVPVAFRDQKKRALGPLELEMQLVVDCHMDAED